MKIRNLILLLVTMVGLVACGTGETSTSEITSVSVPESTSVAAPTLINSWDEDLKGVFNERLGEEIPVAPLHSGTVGFLVDEEENYIWIDGKGNTSFANDYDAMLKTAGYDYLLKNDQEREVYEKELTGQLINYSIYLAFSCENGNVDIFTYIDISITLKAIEAWDAEIVTAMLELFDIELPVFPFFGNIFLIEELATTEEEVYGLNIYGYSADGNGYEESLIDAEFILLGILPNGYLIFEKVLGDGTSIFIDLFYEEMYEGEYYTDIYIYLADTSKGIPTAWEADMIQGLRDLIANGSNFDLPFIELSSFYTYEVFSNEFGDYLEIHDMLSPDLTEEYAALLLDAGFELDEDFLGSGMAVYAYKTDGKIIAVILGYDSNGFHIIVQLYDDVFDWKPAWFIGFELDVMPLLPIIPFSFADTMMIDINSVILVGIWAEDGAMNFNFFATFFYGYEYSEEEGAQIYTLVIEDVGTVQIMIADMIVQAMMQITFTPAS